MVCLPNKSEMIEIRRKVLIFTRTVFHNLQIFSKKDNLEEEDF